MNGIQYITDDKGRKTAAVIDLKKHKKLWEDIEDVLISQMRGREKSVPYQTYRATRSKPKGKRG